MEGKNSAAAKSAATKLNKVIGSSGKGARLALNRIGTEAVNQVKNDLSSSPSPSAPGQPPGVDTGRLRSSYNYQTFPGGDTSGYLLVGTNVEYAPMLEFGTSKMSARPHLRPAILKITEKASQIFVQEILKAENQK